MEEWWISTVGAQKWCPQPRPWQSLRPQSKLMQSTAVLNFAKSKNMKEKKACIPFLAGFSFACSPPGSLPFAFQWLLQGGMENISHLHFSQTFNSAVVGGHMQKGRDWILVSAGSGRNRLQISLWKPPEHSCCPQCHGLSSSAQMEGMELLSQHKDTVVLTRVTATCPWGWESVPSCLWPTGHILHISTLLTALQTQLIQYWAFVKDQPGVQWGNTTKIEFCSLQLLPKCHPISEGGKGLPR